MSRSSRRWPSIALAGALLLAGAYLCFELGRYESGYSIIDQRRIVSPQDGVSGLRIQSLSVVPADGERHFVVRLVLVQAIVHSRRVSGSVKLQLEGVQDGRMTALDAADLVPDKAAYDMAYEFRYFQGLECELILPVGFEPGRFRVEIAPNDPHAEKVESSFEWSDVTE